MTNIYIWYFCQVRTENEWWRNQGILGVGNRHDNTSYFSTAYCYCCSSYCTFLLWCVRGGTWLVLVQYLLLLQEEATVRTTVVLLVYCLPLAVLLGAVVVLVRGGRLLGCMDSTSIV